MPVVTVQWEAPRRVVVSVSCTPVLRPHVVPSSRFTILLLGVSIFILLGFFSFLVQSLGFGSLGLALTVCCFQQS